MWIQDYAKHADLIYVSLVATSHVHGSLWSCQCLNYGALSVEQTDIVLGKSMSSGLQCGRATVNASNDGACQGKDAGVNRNSVL
jgi:hypothetical protein